MPAIPYNPNMRTACVFLLASLAFGAERYQLEPGLELVYEGKMEGAGDGINFETEIRWNIWIVKANRDGSFRIAMRTQGLAEPRLGLGDLRADGTYRPLFVSAYTPLPAALFPPLPAAWGDGKASVVAGDTQYAFRRKVTKEQLVLTFTRSSPEDRVFEASSTHTMYFDPERGLPTRMESRFSQGFGVKSSGHSTTRLADTKRHSRDWAEKLGDEVEGCLRAFQAYDEELDACRGRPEAVDAQAKAAKALLDGALSRFTHGIVREQVEAMLEGHADRVKFAREEGVRLAKYLNKPAAEWMAGDFADRVHSLKGYRGKVIVLDFWYRGCGWCVKAMPQVKRLAKQFAGRPVVVLGANVDPKEEDARYVIKTMALTYPNLKAITLPEKLGVRGYPTVVVIDRKGVVRDYHVGYFADLQERIARKVEALLKE
jgi:thiol-disulfide isomerase/thioredoxin